jgi:exodeoxyribonuclease-3
VFDPVAMQGQLHFHPDEHRALADLMSFGLSDVFRKHHQEGGLFSWWDYRAGAFRRDAGLRIDYVLATAPLAARCTAVDIDVAPREADKPSDHAPVIATFS